jgi:Raf kinase inhibitor-like YbhB/YbcL family protein
MLKKILAVLPALLLVSASASAFELKSNDLKPHAKIPDEYVFNGMSCTGKNVSPELHWSGAPKDTKSFAVTVYDPDAPTGSGWWHWIVINIPATTTSLEKGWKSNGTNGTEIASDFGQPGYGGPCPPPGKPHHYIFTVYALKTAKLDVPAGATHAVARFMILANTIKKASFTAEYGR